MSYPHIVAITILLCVFAFSGNMLAQSPPVRPEARKFHELLRVDEEEELKFHLARYAKQLLRENADAYIISYGPRVAEWQFSKRSIAQINSSQARIYLWNYFPPERIIEIDGGYREKPATELWIVPRGASPPTPTPTISSKDVVHCPVIQIEGQRYVPKPNSLLTFTARIGFTGPTIKQSLLWEISEGKIVTGQGTYKILVELPENTSGIHVTKVTAGGYSLACPVRTTAATFETVVGVGYFKFDEYGQICEEDEKARLDHFSIELNARPDLVAYVVFYGGRCYSSCEIDYPRHRPHYPRRGEAEQRAGRIKPYLVESRGMQADRIFVVNGGFRESWTAELWLVPKGGAPPPVTPTTNAKYIQYRSGKVTERELVFGCMGTKR